ncbi:MAG: sulfocyanin-like copper-binding protein [Gemmatimonadales bacterium]
MSSRIFDRLALGLAAAVLGAACSSRSKTEAAPAPAPASASADTSSTRTAPADTAAASAAAASPASSAAATGADSAARDSSAASPTATDTTTEQATEMNPNPSGTSSTTGASASAGAGDSGYVKYDAGSKTVTFRLVAGPFTFDGYSNGGATLTVPPGTNNVWNFEQGDGTPHSAEIESGEGPLPNSGGNPAIPRAYTNKVVEGLPQGATDVIKFTAPAQGTYRIICGVPGHAVGGMWIWFRIDPSAKAPSLTATPKK